MYTYERESILPLSSYQRNCFVSCWLTLASSSSKMITPQMLAMTVGCFRESEVALGYGKSWLPAGRAKRADSGSTWRAFSRSLPFSSQ